MAVLYYCVLWLWISFFTPKKVWKMKFTPTCKSKLISNVKPFHPVFKCRSSRSWIDLGLLLLEVVNVHCIWWNLLFVIMLIIIINPYVTMNLGGVSCVLDICRVDWRLPTAAGFFASWWGTFWCGWSCSRWTTQDKNQNSWGWSHSEIYQSNCTMLCSVQYHCCIINLV